MELYIESLPIYQLLCHDYFGLHDNAEPAIFVKICKYLAIPIKYTVVEFLRESCYSPTNKEYPPKITSADACMELSSYRDVRNTRSLSTSGECREYLHTVA